MINQIADNVWQLHFKEFGSCVYLIKIPEPILIDTSAPEVKQELLNDLKILNIDKTDIKSIILTHSHWDHTGNLSEFHTAKVYSINNFLELQNDFPKFKFYKTPGHTRDSICILYEKILFSGDTVFDKQFNYIGRTDLPESDPEQMQKTLQFLKKIKYKTIAPGHLV